MWGLQFKTVDVQCFFEWAIETDVKMANYTL